MLQCPHHSVKHLTSLYKLAQQLNESLCFVSGVGRFHAHAFPIVSCDRSFAYAFAQAHSDIWEQNDRGNNEHHIYLFAYFRFINRTHYTTKARWDNPVQTWRSRYSMPRKRNSPNWCMFLFSLFWGLEQLRGYLLLQYLSVGYLWYPWIQTFYKWPTTTNMKKRIKLSGLLMGFL